MIVIDSNAPGPVQTAAGLLAQDIEQVTGFRPDIRSEITDLHNPTIIIGTVTSPLIEAWPETMHDLSRQLAGQWEVYAHRFIRPSSGPFRVMIICGSDSRGTAYGVLDLSRKIGVSPWIWWAESVAPGYGEAVTELFKQYYHLCFERRPEFMGWNQVEYKTLISGSQFNHWALGDEAGKRLDSFRRIAEEAKRISGAVQGDYDAFFECVEYPVRCAYRMNAKFLDMERAVLYARQNRRSANEYALGSRAEYDTIAILTRRYNEIAGGKWRNIMNMAPRELPVFEMQPEPQWKMTGKSGFCITHEGFTDQAYQNNNEWPLPIFYKGENKKHFVDVYLLGKDPEAWHVSVSAPWIISSSSGGKLSDQNGRRQVRLWIEVDWKKVPRTALNRGEVTVSGTDNHYRVSVTAVSLPVKQASGLKFFELNNLVSIWAENPSSQTGWKMIKDLGYTGAVLASGGDSTDGSRKKTPEPVAAYDFYTVHKGKCVVRVYCIPNHAIEGVRLAVKLDDSETKILNFQTVGRSERWKHNVLCNQAGQQTEFYLSEAGDHIITLKALSPDVMADRIEIDFGSEHPAYLAVPETRLIY